MGKFNIQVEVNEHRRIIAGDGFKIYGSDAELRQIVEGIQRALDKGLIQGWVGVGKIDDVNSVFPANGRLNVPTSSWKD